uniref:Uncharacterized protein n=1 Tax=Oryza sativa subsp. japonica TaxID=39947 RepID=Q6ES41_ORYSJ|nr:hypothetical protein [Oryza sativa Japonica Group]BAD28529.1 hypothetical protein [Oryza sativa Japonica Group]
MVERKMERSCHAWGLTSAGCEARKRTARPTARDTRRGTSFAPVGARLSASSLGVFEARREVGCDGGEALALFSAVPSFPEKGNDTMMRGEGERECEVWGRERGTTAMWRRRSWCRDRRSSELWRLEPLALARKAMWMRGDGLAALHRKLYRRADEITLSIQELPDGGGRFEVIVLRRSDMYMNLVEAVPPPLLQHPSAVDPPASATAEGKKKREGERGRRKKGWSERMTCGSHNILFV